MKFLVNFEKKIQKGNNTPKKQYFLALEDDQHALSSITPIIHFNVDHRGCRIFGRSKINWDKKEGGEYERTRRSSGKKIIERPLFIRSIHVSFPWHRLKIIKISFTPYHIPQESMRNNKSTQNIFGSKHLTPSNLSLSKDRFFFNLPYVFIKIAKL